MIELSQILTDHERFLQASDEPSASSLIPTANATQRYTPHGSFATDARKRDSTPHGGYRSRSSQQSSAGSRPSTPNTSSRASPICRFCNFQGHVVKDCRKLARFLRENHLTVSPSVHTTMTTSALSGPSTPWMFDSGASHHAASGVASLQEFSTYDGPDEIHLGNGTSLPISHVGRTLVSTPTRPLSLTNVLCVPQLHKNLVSVSQLCKTNRVSVEFFPSHFLVKEQPTGSPILRGENINGVYYAPSVSPPSINATSLSTLSQLHHRMGHPSNKVLVSILNKCNMTVSARSLSEFVCTSCHINKSHKLPFAVNSLTSTRPLELIYTDVWSTKQISV
ncbi:unnamed protein product, partial [Cuscuta europaea]